MPVIEVDKNKRPAFIDPFDDVVSDKPVRPEFVDPFEAAPDVSRGTFTKPNLTPIISMFENPKQEADKIKMAISDSYLFGVDPSMTYSFKDEFAKAKTLKNIDIQKMKGTSTLGKPAIPKQAGEAETPDITVQSARTVLGGLVDTAKLPWQVLRIYGGLSEMIGGSQAIAPYASEQMQNIETFKKGLNLGTPDEIRKATPQTLDEAFSFEAIPWWINSVLETGTSMAPTLAVGGAFAALGKPIAGLLAGGAVGGLMESENTYNEAKKKGWSNENAAVAATEMMIASGVLNSLSLSRMLKKLPPNLAGKIFSLLGTGTVEYVTELAEEPSEALILQEGIQRAIDATKQAAIPLLPVLFTGMAGGIGGSEITKKTMPLSEKQQQIIKKQQGLLGDEWSHLTPEAINQKIDNAVNMPLGVEAIYQGMMDGLMATGMSENQANAEAIKAIIQTEEGREYIQNVVNVAEEAAQVEALTTAQPEITPEQEAEDLNNRYNKIIESDTFETMTDDEILKELFSTAIEPPASLSLQAAPSLLYHYAEQEITGNTLKAGQPHEQNYFGDAVYLTEKNRYPGKYEYKAQVPEDLKILDLTNDEAYEIFRDKISKKIGMEIKRSGLSLYDDLRETAAFSVNETKTNKAIRKAVAELTKDYDAIKSPYFSAIKGEESFELVVKNREIPITKEGEAKLAVEKENLAERIRKEESQFSNFLDAWGKGKIRKEIPLVVSSTPIILEKLGAKPLNVVISHNVLEKVVYPQGVEKGKHGIPLEMLKKLPEQLHNPVMVLGSADFPSQRVIVLTQLQNKGESLMVAVHLDTSYKHNKVNSIVTIHGRNAGWVKNQIEKGLLRYIDKTKSLEWVQSIGLATTPKEAALMIQGFLNNNILTDDDIVKLNFKGQPMFKVSKPSASDISTADDVIKNVFARAYTILGKKVVKGGFESPDAILNKLSTDVRKRALSEHGLKISDKFTVLGLYEHKHTMTGNKLEHIITLSEELKNNPKELKRTSFHEPFHGIIEIIEAMAKEGDPYAQHILEVMEKEYTNPKRTWKEEASESFADFGMGKTPETLSAKVRAIFERIMRFFRQLGDYLAGRGITSKAEVNAFFERVWIGEFADKEIESFTIPKEEITFTSGGDAIGREYHGWIAAVDKNGKQIGFVDYSYYSGKTAVKMIEVDEKYRRQGIGSLLLNKLQSESNSPISIQGDYATKEGRALWDKWIKQMERTALSASEFADFKKSMDAGKFGAREDIETSDYTELLKKDYDSLTDKERNIVNNLMADEGMLSVEKDAEKLKSTIPTSKVKSQVREATGQVKASDMVKEDEALKAGLIKAVRAGKAAFRAGNKAGVEAERARAMELRLEIKKREKLKDAINGLKKTAEKLSESLSISADYRNKIKDLIGQYELSGHREETIEKLKATQEYIDRAKANGEDVEIPQRILDKLKILGRIPKDQLTLDVVNGLKSEIDLLGKLGKTKWASKQALYEAEKEARKDALLSEASPINSHEVERQLIGSEPKVWIERFFKVRNYLQKSRVSLRPIDGLADITGMTQMKSVLDAAFNAYLAYNDEAFKEWFELTKDFTKGQFQKIGAVAMSRQEGGMERLANSGVSAEEINALKLTPKEEEAYQFVRDKFEAEFPAVKKYALDVYNADVGQVDNYVSFMSDYDAMSDLEMFERFGQRAEEITGVRTKTVEQGFRKERAAISKIKLELDIDKIFRRHMDDVAYMLTMGRDIKQYFEIVNTPEMKDKLGDVGALAWLQWLDLMARKGGTEGAKRIAAIDIVRRNMGAGILGFRISSFMVQFTSFADTIATIGGEWAAAGASKIATSKEWRDFIVDNFPEIKKAIGDDIAFREFGNGMFAKLTQKGFVPLQIFDGIMRSTAAAGAYQKLASEKGIEIDLKNPGKELIQEATRLMRDSQGSSFFKDQPLAITTGYGLTGNISVNKMMLQFQSFMLARWENIERQIWRMGIKERDFKKAFMSFFWLFIVASALEEGIRRGVKGVINLATGDVEGEKPFLSSAVTQAIQSVPIVGQLVSSMTYSSNPVPTIKTFEDAIGGVGSVVKGKETSTKLRGGVRAIGAVGSLAGVPGASQAAQIVNKSLKDDNKPQRR